uniref:Uncharacterized protein n=1 Tax=Oryza brachyantha TaxID=4533 RepID=J3N239_ORYBR
MRLAVFSEMRLACNRSKKDSLDNNAGLLQPGVLFMHVLLGIHISGDPSKEKIQVSPADDQGESISFILMYIFYMLAEKYTFPVVAFVFIDEIQPLTTTLLLAEDTTHAPTRREEDNQRNKNVMVDEPQRDKNVTVNKPYSDSEEDAEDIVGSITLNIEDWRPEVTVYPSSPETDSP